MTPSMVRSIVTALEELGVPARSKDLSDIADTLERVYRERDMLRGMLDRAFDEYIGAGDEPESLVESQAALRDYESRAGRDADVETNRLGNASQAGGVSGVAERPVEVTERSTPMPSAARVERVTKEDWRSLAEMLLTTKAADLNLDDIRRRFGLDASTKLVVHPAVGNACRCGFDTGTCPIHESKAGPSSRAALELEALRRVAAAANRVDSHEDFGSQTLCPECVCKEPAEHDQAWTELGAALVEWRKVKLDV